MTSARTRSPPTQWLAFSVENTCSPRLKVMLDALICFVFLLLAERSGYV